MPRGVHALMENSNYICRTAVCDIEDQVAAHAVAAIVTAYVIYLSTSFGVACDTLDRFSNFDEIHFRLVHTPLLFGEIPD